MAINQRTVVGNLVADPTLRFTPSGAPVVNFRIAHTPRQKNPQSGEWENGESEFIDCTAWRSRAENIAESLSKGDSVIVIGNAKNRSYTTKEGEKRTVSEIVVEEVGPSLEWATAKITRVSRGGGGGNYQNNSGSNQSGNQGGGNQASNDNYSDEPPF